MKFNEIESIALVYGQKELIEEFLEIFQIDRAHDNAPLSAILLEGETKKDIKNHRFLGSLRNPK